MHNNSGITHQLLAIKGIQEQPVITTSVLSTPAGPFQWTGQLCPVALSSLMVYVCTADMDSHIQLGALAVWLAGLRKRISSYIYY